MFLIFKPSVRIRENIYKVVCMSYRKCGSVVCMSYRKCGSVVCMSYRKCGSVVCMSYRKCGSVVCMSYRKCGSVVCMSYRKCGSVVVVFIFSHSTRSYHILDDSSSDIRRMAYYTCWTGTVVSSQDQRGSKDVRNTLR